MGKISIMCQEGDTKLIWDANNADEVEAARKMYNDLKKKGHAAYSVKKDGKKGEVIHEFDEDAEKIIMIPPMQGG